MRDHVVQLARHPRSLAGHRQPRALIALVLELERTQLEARMKHPSLANDATGEPRSQSDDHRQGKVLRSDVGREQRTKCRPQLPIGQATRRDEDGEHRDRGAR